ncbi:MAG: ankyrin repeat domain-containing protein, partial [Clostridia bacterium]|nr:ankyrin repeat domain-containing protein [Clostridia bacterium]
TTTTKTINKKGTIILIATVIFGLPSCTYKESSAKNNFQTNEVKIGKPKMDINTATFTGNLKEVKKHIHHKLDLNIKDPMGGSTPLITACLFGKNEIAKALIDAGADLNIQNKEGSTALHCASFFCNTELTAYLIKNKADQTIKNKQGATPFESMQGNFDQVKPFYQAIEKQLKPLGFKLDYEHLEKTRPIIRHLLKSIN